jgi:hypothetical protein
LDSGDLNFGKIAKNVEAYLAIKAAQEKDKS